MNILLNVTVEDLEKYINRQINVSDEIELANLCEYINVSLNGKKALSYILEYSDTVYYPYPIYESDNEKELINLKLKDLNLKVNSTMEIYYGIDEETADFYFTITIDKIKDNKTNKVNNNFEVLSGKGYGIIDDIL